MIKKGGRGYTGDDADTDSKNMLVKEHAGHDLGQMLAMAGRSGVQTWEKDSEKHWQ